MHLLLILAIAAFGFLVITTSKPVKPGQPTQALAIIKQLLDKIPSPERLTANLAGSLRAPGASAPSAGLLPTPAPHREAVPTDPAEPTQADIDRRYQTVITHGAGTRIVEAVPIVQGPDGPRSAPEQPHFRVITEDALEQPAARKPTPQAIVCAQQAQTGRFLPLECGQ